MIIFPNAYLTFFDVLFSLFLSALLRLLLMLWPLPKSNIKSQTNIVSTDATTMAQKYNKTTRTNKRQKKMLRPNSAETSIGTPAYKTHMRLTIFSVSIVDYTTYKCVAKNPRGETDGSIRLYGKYIFLLFCSFFLDHNIICYRGPKQQLRTIQIIYVLIK